MPTVPDYRAQTTNVGITNAVVRPSVPGGAFGTGGVDASLLQRGADALASVAMTMQTDRNEIAVKDASLKASAELDRFLRDPQDGLLFKQGVAADGATKLAQQKFGEIYAKMMEGLENDAQRKVFSDYWRATSQAQLSSVMAFEGSQLRKANLDRDSAIVQQAQLDAVGNRNNVVNVMSQLTIAESAIRSTASKLGWSEEQTKLALTQTRSQMGASVVEAILTEDKNTTQAQRVFDAYDKSVGFDPVTKAALQIKLSETANLDSQQSYVDDLFIKHGLQGEEAALTEMRKDKSGKDEQVLTDMIHARWAEARRLNAQEEQQRFSDTFNTLNDRLAEGDLVGANRLAQAYRGDPQEIAYIRSYVQNYNKDAGKPDPKDLSPLLRSAFIQRIIDASQANGGYTTLPQIDEFGNFVVKQDANGLPSPVPQYQTDASGRVLLDENGQPTPKMVKLTPELLTMVMGATGVDRKDAEDLMKRYQNPDFSVYTTDQLTTVLNQLGQDVKPSTVDAKFPWLRRELDQVFRGQKPNQQQLYEQVKQLLTPGTDTSTWGFLPWNWSGVSTTLGEATSKGVSGLAAFEPSAKELSDVQQKQALASVLAYNAVHPNTPLKVNSANAALAYKYNLLNQQLANVAVSPLERQNIAAKMKELEDQMHGVPTTLLGKLWMIGVAQGFDYGEPE